MNNTLRSCLLLAALGGMAVLTHAAPISSNLIQNGSFENPGVNANSWSMFTTLQGWNVGANQIEVRNKVSGQAYDGSNFVELDVVNNSSIWQSFQTQKGQNYLLSFAYANRPDNKGASSNGIQWSLGNLFSGVVGNNTATNWTVFEQSFVGTGGLLTLTFAGYGKSDGYGTSLDAVSVTTQSQDQRVPEPGSLALLVGAGAALLLAARRRRA